MKPLYLNTTSKPKLTTTDRVKNNRFFDTFVAASIARPLKKSKNAENSKRRIQKGSPQA